MSKSYSPPPPVDNTALIAEIENHIDTRAATTEATIAASTNTTVVTDGDVTQALIDSLATTSATIDANVQGINAHTDAALLSLGFEWYATEPMSGLVQIFTGATGVLFSIAPPTGKRVMLRLVYCNNGLMNTTITRGAVTVVDSKLLRNVTQDGAFSVGGYDLGTTPYILGKPDEVIELSTTSTVPSSHLFYAFEIGEIK